MVSKSKATKGSIQAIDYILDDKGKAQELDRNLICGENGNEILSEFRDVQALRERCVNNTYSIVLSPSNERNFSNLELREFGREHLKNLGLENHQYLMTVHRSTDQPHIHIIANRISLKGEMHNDSFIGKKAQFSAEKIAKEHGLTTAKEVAQIHKMEIAPIKEEIKQAHYFASSKTTDFKEYMDLMYSRGVIVVPSMNKQGEMQGFRFEHRQSGINLKSSEVGKDFGIKNLAQKGFRFTKIPLTTNVQNLVLKIALDMVSKEFKRSKGRGLGI